MDCWQDSGRCHPLARPSVQVANSEVRTKHYHHRRMNFGAHGNIRPPIHRPPCRVGPDSNPKFVSALPFSIATPSLSFHSNRYYRLVTGHIDKKKHVHSTYSEQGLPTWPWVADHLNHSQSYWVPSIHANIASEFGYRLLFSSEVGKEVLARSNTMSGITDPCRRGVSETSEFVIPEPRSSLAALQTIDSWDHTFWCF